jgi:hypothetical protein
MSCECSRLLLSNSNIAQYTDILRENVLAGTNDCHRGIAEVLMIPLFVWVWFGTTNSSNSADELYVFAAVKDDCMVRVV